jgi:hypothetical protein
MAKGTEKREGRNMSDWYWEVAYRKVYDLFLGVISNISVLWYIGIN